MKKRVLSKKSLLALVLVLIFAVMALTGCSANGNSYMKLSSEIATLDQYTYDGTVKMGIDLDSMLQGQNLSDADKTLLAAYKNIKITYTGASNAAENKHFFSMKLSVGNGKTYPLDIYVGGMDKILFNSEHFVGLLKGFGASEEEVQATKAALNGIEWINYDQVLKMLPSFYSELDTLALNKQLYDFFIYLGENSYKNYNPNIFTKSGNVYKMTISDQDLPQLVTDLVIYSFDNLPAIAKDFKTIVNTVDKSLLDAVDLTRDELNDLLDEIIAGGLEITPEDRDLLRSAIPALMGYLDGTELESSIEKIGSNKYKENVKFVFGLKDPNSTLSMKMNMDIVMNIQVKDVTVSMPANYADVSSLAAAETPNSFHAVILLKDGTVMYNKYYTASILNSNGLTTVTTKEVNGYNYLPMRQLAELFGETVEWDQENYKAYVVRGDQKIEMTGFIEDGRTYVKLRSFEALGYTVDYEVPEKTGSPIVTIVK